MWKVDRSTYILLLCTGTYQLARTVNENGPAIHHNFTFLPPPCPFCPQKPKAIDNSRPEVLVVPSPFFSLSDEVDTMATSAEPATQSTLVKAAKATYWTYKVIQVGRVAVGDVTAVAELCAEICAEFLLEGVAEGVIEGVCTVIVSNPDLIIETAEAVKDAHEGAKELQENVKELKETLKAPSK